MTAEPSKKALVGRYVPVAPLTGQWADLPELPPLPQGSSEEGGRPLRVCIATYDMAGLTRCGGVGTAYATLARSLAEAGHEATILYLSRRAETRTPDYWVSRYREWGVRLVSLPKADLPLGGTSTPCVRHSYEAYLWLREGDFDLIHFPERLAPGYWSLVAKHQGLAFQDTVLCVGMHGPTLWSRLADAGYVSDLYDLQVDFMERRSVALADVAWLPSQYLARWAVAHGWRLPDRCYVQPHLMPHAARPSAQARPAGTGRRQVSEIVFFGRLEPRKGLLVFCDALDRLAREGRRDIAVTFLGRAGRVEGRRAGHVLAEHGGGWPFPWQVLTDRAHEDAVDYLRQGGRLAVMPSLDEAFGLGVLECAGLGVPFVAGRVGGVSEVVAEEDRDEALVVPEAEPLARRLAAALDDGVRPARPAVDPQANEQAWLRWHDGLPRRATRGRVAAQPVPDDRLPLVSVCLVTYNRPRLLQQALDSIRALDYPRFEVVLVDDASTEPDALALLDELAPEFAERGWQIIRHPTNRFPEASRNTAARHAHGDYLLFMDDDNLALPHELRVFVQVALRTSADVVTCFRRDFTDLKPPAPADRALRHWLFLGPDAATGLFRNVFGDNNALVRRSTYESLGGQSEFAGLGCEDWELYARAVLAGCTFETVPEALFLYRVLDDGVYQSSPKEKNLLRVARAYRDAVPEPLRPLVLLAQGAVLHRSPAEEPQDYRRLPGLHLVRMGLRNCWREGPVVLIRQVLSKLRGRRRAK